MSGVVKNIYINFPQVIDKGSKENSFKVINYLKKGGGTGPGSNVYALNISEFVDGDKKPFLFMRNTYVLQGTCLHF